MKRSQGSKWFIFPLINFLITLIVACLPSQSTFGQIGTTQQLEILIDNPGIDPAKLELSIQGRPTKYEAETRTWTIDVEANQMVDLNGTYPGFQQFSQVVFIGASVGGPFQLHIQFGPPGSRYLRKRNLLYPAILNIENLAIALGPSGSDRRKLAKFLSENALLQVEQTPSRIPGHLNENVDFVRVRRLDRLPMNNPEDRWIQKIVDAGYSPGLFLDEYLKQSYHYPLTIEFEKGLSEQGIEQYLVENNLRFHSRFDNFITVVPEPPLDFNALEFLIVLQTNPNVVSIDWTYGGQFSWH
jgi:hypothetical protein